jgi:hypothetical protein
MAMVMISVLQGLGQQFFPPPAGMDPSDPEAFAAAFATMPVMALVTVLLSYALGTFAGAWIATGIGGRAFYAFLVGGVMTLAGMEKLFSSPQPLWFTIASALVFLPSAWFASRVANFD